MKTHQILLTSTLLMVTGLSVASTQNTAFTYQGRVTSGGSAFSGAGQFKFALVTTTNLSRQATATAVLSGPFVVDYNLTFGGNGYVTPPAVTISGGGGSGATAHAVISGGMVVDVVADTAGSGYTSPPTVTIAPPPPSIAFTSFWSNDGTSVNGSEPVAAVSVPVSSGLFTVVLGDTTLANMAAIDVSVFSQRKLHLRIWFNDGVNGFAALSPPQELTPTPYAISLLGTLPASQVTGTLSSANLSGISGPVSLNNTSNSFSGSFAGNGGGLSNVSANALVVIRTNISIVTWGDSQFGQRIVPPGLDNVVAVSPGITHSLALEADGTVTAWGAGKTNDPGNTIEAGQSIVPAGLGNVAAVAAGYLHSLALKTDGTVIAWGRNNEGQTNVPAGLNNVVQVSAGGFHNVALKSDRTVVTWGTNIFGQLAIPGGLNDVVAVSAGVYHSLALKSDGTVVAWGGGQTNDPSTGVDFGQSIVPAGLANVVAIAAGGVHSLALKADGAVVAWGAGTTNDPSTSIHYGQSIVPAGLNNVTAVAPGYVHSLALKSDGTVVAWGGSGLGEEDVPPGLNHVVALGTGSAARHGLAMRTRARAPIAVLDSDNTFNGSVEIKGDLSASGDVSFGGDIRLNDGNLWLRGGNDDNNGLGWYGTGKPFGNGTPSGPVLFGESGGALATIGTNGIQTALIWDSSRHVGINANPSTNAALTLGQQGSPSAILLPGGHGIGSASGIRFHLNQGGGSGGGQFVFSDAPSGRDLVTIQSIFGSFFGVGIGTTTPNVRLDVIGDIQLGSSGQLYAPGGVENLRILRGRISGAGGITTGEGFTVSKPNTGIYTVTFTPAFASQPTCTATPQVGLARIATCSNVGASSAQFLTFVSTTGAAIDQDFHFIAIGPR